MTEKDFNLVLSNLMKKEELGELPCFFYDRLGEEEGIFNIIYLGTHIVKEKEVVAFAEIFGNVRESYHSENNARVDKHICPIESLEEYLGKRLEMLKMEGIIDSPIKENVVSDSVDVIISNVNKLDIKIPPEIMLLITNAIAEAFEKGEMAVLDRKVRETYFFKRLNDTVDFTKYFM